MRFSRSTCRKRPDTDRDLGLRFPDILSSAGLSVQRHKDYFAHDCEDVEWLIRSPDGQAITHGRNSILAADPIEKDGNGCSRLVLALDDHQEPPVIGRDQ